MVATRRLDYSPKPLQGRRGGQVYMLAMKPVAEQYSTTILQRAKNAPPRLQIDHVENGRVVNNLMTRAEHHFPGGFRHNRPRHTAESLEEGMNIIMSTSMHKEVQGCCVPKNG